MSKKKTNNKKVSRVPLKILSNKPVKFIPPTYQNLDEHAEKMCDRPLIVYGRKMTRDEKFNFDEQTVTTLPKNFNRKDPESIKQIKITGKGHAYKFVFDTCITKIENVLLQEVGGDIEEVECLEGEEIQRYWNSVGDELAVLEIITYFINLSSFSEAEVKN